MRLRAATVRPLRALFGGLGEPVPWPELDAGELDHLIRALGEHGVLPLVHWAARGARATALPPSLARAAEGEYMATAASAALRTRELSEVHAALAEIGVDPLLLKGAALALTDYENVALRPMGDLDLLVREPELAAAAGVLEARGYLRKVEEAPELAHHLAFARPLAAGVVSSIELHRRPLATPPFDRALETDALMARADAVDVGGRSMRVPCRSDMLVHVAAHLVLQHARAERLIWVADVDRVARRLDAARWTEALDRAAAEGLSRSLRDAVAAARIWFGTPVPAGVVAALDDAASAGGRASADHARVRARAPLGLEGARRLTDMRGARGWSAKLRYAAAFAFPSPEYMRHHHGVDRTSALPIYYARRVARGLAHVAAELAGRPDRRAAADEPPEAWMVEADSRSSVD